MESSLRSREIFLKISVGVPFGGCRLEVSGWGRTGVVRGGSWGNNNPDNLRASYRNNNHPGNRNNNIGFRVVVVGAACKAAQMRKQKPARCRVGRKLCAARAKMPSLTPPSTPRASPEG